MPAFAPSHSPPKKPVQVFKKSIDKCSLFCIMQIPNQIHPFQSHNPRRTILGRLNADTETTTNPLQSTSPSRREKVSKKIDHQWSNNSQEGETPTVPSRTTPESTPHPSTYNSRYWQNYKSVTHVLAAPPLHRSTAP